MLPSEIAAPEVTQGAGPGARARDQLSRQGLSVMESAPTGPTTGGHPQHTCVPGASCEDHP